MKYPLAAVYVAGALSTMYLAFWVDAASAQLVVFYVVASAAAWGLSLVAKPWATWVKWTWVVLSLAMLFAVITGPLNDFQLT